MKTAVITGGNSGVGKATALLLAQKGYRIIIHGRDAEKTLSAASEIRNASGAEVHHIVTDISSLKGMKLLADAIKQKTSSIDVLILSTGVILPKHVLTEDGLEAGFAIQYLSRFATVQQLMPLLNKNGKSRIVVIGAPLLKDADIYFDDIAFKKGFKMMKAMGQEMLANHLFVQEFAKKYGEDGPLINILHPGVTRTGIVRETGFFLKLLVNIAGHSPAKAAANPVYLASDEDAGFTGYFLKKPGKPNVKEKLALDPKKAERLWNMSLEMIRPIL